ncbi:phospholipase A1-IIdelta-like [Cynara cardunculus var. scolymus]|uniref:Phospholipase A1 n=1 Tax=Cynara cardunculus var. scolymus TaxID=59895 RepID=A0A124SDX5_CYNCS|nr:phospholipase A1-IIdelta-like [Cynara cardunculus var. scolymus]KVH98275.1 Lipase, class 3 [Cynara cardunculus var. scolymus]
MASKTYEELHGSNNWDGLLDPLDPGLRTLILGYGDLSSAAERAFNNDDGSRYAGCSCYGKSSFFQGVMLPWAESKYTVTSFIYTTAHVDFPLSSLISPMSRENSEFESNWMGFLAVSKDEFSKSIGCREICVVWRGTVRTYEWINDIKDVKPVTPDLPIPSGNGGSTTGGTPKIMEGWLIIYNTSNPNSESVKTSARTQLLAQIRGLLVMYKDEKISITCTGHSLGASLAIVSAFDLAANVATPDIKVSAFVFASPRVGNQDFKEKMEELHNLKVMSIKNVNDIVPKWPSKVMEWDDDKIKFMSIPKHVLSYVDVGIDILIDSKNSPYFKEKDGLDVSQVIDFHNLEGMLHLVAGYDGKDREFDWKSIVKRRSLALANMCGDLLKEKYKIPQSWWTEKNKGMVLNDSGDWVLSPIDHDDHDLSPTK